VSVLIPSPYIAYLFYWLKRPTSSLYFYVVDVVDVVDVVAVVTVVTVVTVVDVVDVVKGIAIYA